MSAAAASAPSPDGGRAYRRVLDQLGRSIIAGDLPAGRVVNVEWAMERTGASRSVVREATRVLVSLGLLVARQRVGLTVTASDAWDALDGDVVRWRLDSADHDAQIAELLDLRLAVEPAAARAAATRRTLEQAAALAAAARELADAAARRDAAAFFEADASFHSQVIAASGNRMFVRLQAVLREALRERTPHAPVRWRDAPADARLHAEVAAAIQGREAEVAEEVMGRIVRGD
ncbi:FadR/GntR family transcriptional regulator [Leifsonia shinshuensis]|uniref:FadR family transcriptional regulator n=1 Tax=Leifsonia shinshuensis TaxID=150026 RepID=A0A7G6YAK8_9MICO|nr:FCD domain-containing protein [Leifsonia shinshuensis]QNE35523.1 FadR family transcriptional regulator [Leifsonia shinshuensis]